MTRFPDCYCPHLDHAARAAGLPGGNRCVFCVAAILEKSNTLARLNYSLTPDGKPPVEEVASAPVSGR